MAYPKGKDNHLYRHGHTVARNGKWSSMYIRFMNLKARCLRPCDKDYPRYGARGVTVCDRWLHGENGKTGFECFLEDMGEPPFDKASVDRVDTTKGYSPENCRWANAIQQGNNRVTNHLVTIKEETKTIAEWSRISGVGPKTIRYRLIQGVPPEQAVFDPPNRKRRLKHG